jgi:hypothetical protein
VEVQVLLPTFQLIHWIMSLISQKDRVIAIAALENYVMKLRTENQFDDVQIMEANALLNWIKLEYQKHMGD